MPCCNAASLATPAAASQEGGLAVATGLHSEFRVLTLWGQLAALPACENSCIYGISHRAFSISLPSEQWLSALRLAPPSVPRDGEI